MRRTDLEISDRGEIEEILGQSQVLHVGLFDEAYPYVFPITYGYRDGRLYMHSATTGKKIDLIRRDPRASFQVETDVVFHDDPKKSSGITLTYRSVIGFGSLRILEDSDEKREGIRILAAHYDERGARVERSDEALRNVAILELTIDHMTGKQHERSSPFASWSCGSGR
ncbi:MAG: pyridoxamine 5'-phosphate oxidase family protein [Synergistales bacterium]|nr:pyridoxamine 5'-phosphate oxidase family protein [Synergistales bacterium]